MRLTPGPIVVASHNPGKVREIVDLLGPYGFDVSSAAELGLPEPEETGTTFEGNAILKARAAAQASGMPALADDFGLAVEALGGEPGIYSARWAGPTKDFGSPCARSRTRSHAAGADTPERRRAHFVSVLALAAPGGEVETFAGRVDGTLVWPPRGDLGFGYDPMFLPDGHDRTFGEMSAEEKHGWRPGQREALSHRARAFMRFARDCLERRAMIPESRTAFGIYVHWPFCAAKCPYCDFNSHVRHQAAGPAALCGRLRARARPFRGAHARPHRHQHLPRRRHALAHAAQHGAVRFSMRLRTAGMSRPMRR